MEDNLIEDLEQYRVVMPKVRILPRRLEESKRKECFLDIYNSIKKKKIIPIVEMLYSPNQEKEYKKISFGLDNQKSQVRTSHTQSPQHSKYCALPRKDYKKIMNSQKITATKDLSIIGSVINNKDWASMLLFQSSFLNVQEKSRNLQINCDLRVNKSIQSMKKRNNKLFRGRILASPNPYIP